MTFKTINLSASFSVSTRNGLLQLTILWNLTVHTGPSSTAGGYRPIPSVMHPPLHHRMLLTPGQGWSRGLSTSRERRQDVLTQSGCGTGSTWSSMFLILMSDISALTVTSST